MSITLKYNPWSRSADVVWMLEELGLDYTLDFVDFRTGAHKTPEFKAINRMGKLPVLIDGDVTVSERSAVGVYLADRYSLGTLAPALDAPDRGQYLRWCFYAPSVIEPGCTAKQAGWEFRPSSVGWGTFEEMNATLKFALSAGPWLLGERFTMADVVLGGTLRWMLRFNMLEGHAEFAEYAARLDARPAAVKAREINDAKTTEYGLA